MPFPERYLETAREAFGDATAEIKAVAARAKALFDRPVIVWEGDAQTFAFSYVSEGAEQLLGHPSRRWIEDASFWASVVVHPEDRADAVAYCALATGKCLDHAFVYRARTADGAVRWLADYVQVIRGSRRVAERLRGIMIDVSEELGGDAASQAWRAPAAHAIGRAVDP